MVRRRRRWPWLLPLAALAWLGGVAGYIVWVGSRDDARPADVIIVLGAAAWDARPSPVFAERLRHGVDLYQRRQAPYLLFTGGYGGFGARYAESQVGQRYAERQGVPAAAILIETVSRTTRENLHQAAALMHAHGLRSAIIVSDPLHMARGLRLAREEGIAAVGSPTPTSRFRSLPARLKFLLQEVYFFHRDLVLEAR
ncbi:MAG: YdcF family protein [Pseudoxanthomonas sp.]